MAALYPRVPKSTPALDVLYPAEGGYPLSAGLPASAREFLPEHVVDIFEEQPNLYLASHYSSTRVWNKITRRVVIGGATPNPPSRRRRPFPPVLAHPALHPKVSDHIAFLQPTMMAAIRPSVYRLLDAITSVPYVVNEHVDLTNPAVRKYLAEFDGDLPPFFFTGLIECDHCAADPERQGACLFATLGRQAPTRAPPGPGPCPGSCSPCAPCVAHGHTPRPPTTPPTALALRCLWCTCSSESCTFSFKPSEDPEVKGVELFALLTPEKIGAEEHRKTDGDSVAKAVWWADKDGPLPEEEKAALKITINSKAATVEEIPDEKAPITPRIVSLRPENQFAGGATTFTTAAEAKATAAAKLATATRLAVEAKIKADAAAAAAAVPTKLPTAMSLPVKAAAAATTAKPKPHLGFRPMTLAPIRSVSVSTARTVSGPVETGGVVETPESPNNDCVEFPLSPPRRGAETPTPAGAAASKLDKQMQVIKKPQSQALIPLSALGSTSRELVLAQPPRALNLSALVEGDKPVLVRDLAAVFDAHAAAAEGDYNSTVYASRASHADKAAAARAAYEEAMRAADESFMAEVEKALASHTATVEEHNRKVRAVAVAVGQIPLLA